MTFLFDDIIIGPIISRRLGVSLGVNLLPTNGKLCNFNCIYCECGWTKSTAGMKLRFNPTDEVLQRLEQTLKSRSEACEPMDVITFAGNGEPTMHPDFAYIIDKTLELRDRYFPDVKVSVITNATLIANKNIREALQKVDKALLKIDAVHEDKIKVINDPYNKYSLRELIEGIKLFEGDIIIQTMFLKGTQDGKIADNTSKEDIDAWIEVLKEINPTEVVIYSLDRDTPSKSISKVPAQELQAIADRLQGEGIKCTPTL